MLKIFLTAGFLYFQCNLAFCVLSVDNPELATLDAADQQERKAALIDWAQVTLHDSERAKAVRRIVQNGGVRTAADYAHAAEVLIHGGTFENFQLSYALARVGATIAPEDKKLKALCADAWDRAHVAKNRLQWYGTQFRREGDGDWMLDPFDKNVLTDEERANAGGLTSKQIDERLVQYRAADSAIPKSATSSPDDALEFKGGSLKFVDDKEAMLALADQNPALGLFWRVLSQKGAADSIDTQQKYRIGFLTIPRQDAVDIINGKRTMESITLAQYGSFLEFSMSSNAQKQLLIDIRLDDKVLPQPTLKFNFSKHYRITAENVDQGSDGQRVKFISTVAVADQPR